MPGQPQGVAHTIVRVINAGVGLAHPLLPLTDFNEPYLRMTDNDLSRTVVIEHPAGGPL